MASASRRMVKVWLAPGRYARSQRGKDFLPALQPLA
jgi:hypothetical protein